VGSTSNIERLLWLALDVGRDDRWTTANDALLKNLANACAARPWLRLVLIGISDVRANELQELFPPDVAVALDRVRMVEFNTLKQHAEVLAARHPGQIEKNQLRTILAAFWKEIEGASKTDADRHLRCVETVRCILQLRSLLLQSRASAA